MFESFCILLFPVYHAKRFPIHHNFTVYVAERIAFRNPCPVFQFLEFHSALSSSLATLVKDLGLPSKTQKKVFHNSSRRKLNTTEYFCCLKYLADSTILFQLKLGRLWMCYSFQNDKWLAWYRFFVIIRILCESFQQKIESVSINAILMQTIFRYIPNDFEILIIFPAPPSHGRESVSI